MKSARGRQYPVTPDGRYFVVKDRLWRTTNPNIDENTRTNLVRELMNARRDVGAAQRGHDATAESAARARVNRTKIDLGERGPVWWDAAEGDWNQHKVQNSPYAQWFDDISHASS